MPARPVVFALVSLIVATNAALTTQAPASARVAQVPEIPDVTGKVRDTALLMLARTRLPIAQVESATTQYRLNTVIVQRPAAHTPLARAAAETIFIAAAPRKVSNGVIGRIAGTVIRPPAVNADSASSSVVVQDTTHVPELYDRDPRTVSELLKQYRLTAGAAQRDYSDSVVPGHVFRQRPERGTVVSTGTPVMVWYSIGPNPNAATLIVPDVRGLKLAAASDSLRRARFAVGHIDTVYLAKSNGNVSHQEPHEGSKAHAGDTVDLTLSMAPAQFPVPNVRGKTRAAAEAILKKSGFGVGVVTQVAIAGRDTTIIDQKPDSGAMRNRGFLVNLVENRAPKIRRVIVPNLKGMSRAVAGDTLRRAGLVLGDVVLNDNGASPKVALQLPLPGDTAALNSAVNVTLASPQTRRDSTIVSDVLVRVPAVVNLTAERARRTLNDSGFTIVTTKGDTITSAAVVDSQRPLGGDLVRANSPMLLFTTFTKPRKVPRVTGQGEDDARATAQADQYKLVVTARRRGIRLREVVDSQAPSANANARPDAVIDVRLAIPLVPPVPAAIVLSLASMTVVVRRTRISLRKSPPEHPPKPPGEVTLTPVMRAAEAPTLSQGGGTLIRHAFTLTFSVQTDAWRVDPAGTSLIKPKEPTNG